MDDKKSVRDTTCTMQASGAESPEQQPAPAARKAFLTVIRSAATDLGLHIVVEKPISLGRDPDSDFTLQDLRISWNHAQVSPREDSGYVVEDLGSTNGTRVNGITIQGPYPLQDGSKIFVGETVIRFSLADEIDLCFTNEVAQLVGTDPLTGLESKRKFDSALDYELALAKRSHSPLAVLMMDMDGVKAINDTHGHLFGAYVIQETGEIIASIVDDSGHACRFGGDEFTAFLPRLSTDPAVEIAERIRRAVEIAPMVREAVVLKPTISIGVASYPTDGETVIELIEAADRALYRAKAAGKNQVSR